MNLSQFPERFRARVLSGIVRSRQIGVAIRFGKLEGETLPLSVSQETSISPVSQADLEQVARTAFAALPYDLRIQVQ